MTPYCNNLKKDDPVLHCESRRPGRIANNPRSTSRFVSVLWQGTRAPVSTDVMKLRYIVNGVPEDVPPVDGEPPPLRNEADAPRAVVSAGLDALKHERDTVCAELSKLYARVKTATEQRDRLDRAIAVLEPQP